ncbi:hypothetical protein CKO28_01020 [Rhodovibrio sodomensis]|uniref:Uncharacterized protein n=1 Tax=Rhodovibrio sodomensis TaxID=1088 RepID=A0ABS1D882_9PROT|nr:hypothetical protein [Rhodovibrio sodomensis]MBK1666624.1 hypothetical protein [Rhodovibrio sodomensis]
MPDLKQDSRVLSNALSSFLAKGIKTQLAEQGIQVTHTQLLTAIARTCGFDSANAMRATAEAGEDPRPSIDPKKARYWRTRFVLDVLSEDAPLTDDDLATIAYECDEGACVGHMQAVQSTPLTADEARVALMAAGSEPGFFESLEDDGEDDAGAAGSDDAARASAAAGQNLGSATRPIRLCGDTVRQLIGADPVATAERWGLCARQVDDGWVGFVPGTKDEGTEVRPDRKSALTSVLERVIRHDGLNAWTVDVEFYSLIAGDDEPPFHTETYALAAPSREAAAIAAEQLAYQHKLYDERIQPALTTRVLNGPGIDEDELVDELDDMLSEPTTWFLEAEVRNESLNSPRPATLATAIGSLQQMDQRTLRSLNAGLRDLLPVRDQVMAELEAHAAINRLNTPLTDIIDW